MNEYSLAKVQLNYNFANETSRAVISGWTRQPSLYDNLATVAKVRCG